MAKICWKFTLGYGASAKIRPLATEIYPKIDPWLRKFDKKRTLAGGTPPPYTTNSMPADALVTLRARVSTEMVFTPKLEYSISSSKRVKICSVITELDCTKLWMGIKCKRDMTVVFRHWSYVIFCINTLRLRQDGRHFPDNILKCVFLNENVWNLIKISLRFVPAGSINNSPALVQIMACARRGDKPLFELMVI